MLLCQSDISKLHLIKVSICDFMISLHMIPDIRKHCRLIIKGAIRTIGLFEYLN